MVCAMVFTYKQNTKKKKLYRHDLKMFGLPLVTALFSYSLLVKLISLSAPETCHTTNFYGNEMFTRLATLLQLNIYSKYFDSPFKKAHKVCLNTFFFGFNSKSLLTKRLGTNSIYYAILVNSGPHLLRFLKLITNPTPTSFPTLSNRKNPRIQSP